MMILAVTDKEKERVNRLDKPKYSLFFVSYVLLLTDKSYDVIRRG